MTDILCLLCSSSVAIHEKGFIGFVVFSVLHMLLSCYLYKRGRPEPWNSNVSSSSCDQIICACQFHSVGKTSMEVSIMEYDHLHNNALD